MDGNKAKGDISVTPVMQGAGNVSYLQARLQIAVHPSTGIVMPFALTGYVGRFSGQGRATAGIFLSRWSFQGVLWP